MDAARRLVFLKGNDAHDYKFSSAVLEDYGHVSPHWRNRYLAASLFYLPGSGAPDNALVGRTRAASGRAGMTRAAIPERLPCYDSGARLRMFSGCPEGARDRGRADANTAAVGKPITGGRRADPPSGGPCHWRYGWPVPPYPWRPWPRQPRRRPVA